MNDKNEAMELAQHLESLSVFESPLTVRAAMTIRSQVAEIGRLTTERDMSRWKLKNLDDAEAKESMYRVGLTQEREITNLTKECDQLKAKNEKLIDLLTEVSRNYTRDDDLPDELLPRIDVTLEENT